MLPDLNVRIIICTIIICIYWLCWGPLLIYAIYRFYSNSDTMIIAKRNPKFTVLHSIIALIGIMIYGPIYALYSSGFDSTVTIICYYLNLFLYPFIAYPWIWGIAIKYWLLSFKINWAKSTQNATWKMHINQSQANHNWFIIHKKTFGSTRYTLKIVFFIWLLSVTSYWIVILFVGAITVTFSIVQLFIILIPTIIIIIMWCKTPLLYDHLYYVEECRLILIFGGIYMFCYLFVGISPILGATDYIRQILGNVVGTLAYFGVGLFQLEFSLNKLKLSEEDDLAKHVINRQRSLSIDEITKHRDIWSTMIEIMENGDKLNGFFDHLAQEFSIECGLSYIEFLQFKQVIDNDLFPNKRHITDQKEICILSNNEIPKSFIVYADIDKITYHARHRSKMQFDVPDLTKYGNSSFKLEDTVNNIGNKDINNNLNEYQERAYLLYRKYIDQSAELEINISCTERERLTKLLLNRINRENIDDETLLTIWNNAIHELWRLMTNSCYRFIKTTTYQRLSQYSPSVPSTKLEYKFSVK